jgi:tetratricopeptide (TPR) repeat protein
VKAAGLRRAVAGVLLASAVACAKAPPPKPPEAGEYLYPVAAPGELTPDEARQMEKAWRDLMAGDVPEAEKTFQKLAGRKSDLVPAQTGLAFARLKLGRLAEAAAGFSRALALRPEYLPALVGAGATAQKQGDPAAALAFLRRAVAVQPADALLRKRLAEVKIQITERRVAEAHAALEAGDPLKAEERYRQALEAAPELAGVRLQLADLLEPMDPLAAADVLEADPTEDRAVLGRLGTLLTAQKQYERALDAWRRILSRDPRDAEALKRSRETIAAIEFAKMPEEYQRIPGAPRISRADLAALLSAKVPQLGKIKEREPRVAIDISGSWAREHIVSLLALDVMDVYPNHSFQPGAIVRRGDLARAAARVLDLFRVRAPGAASPPSDMARANLYFEASLRVVGAGLMSLTPEGAFEPWRPVSGQEAVEVISGVARLVGS